MSLPISSILQGSYAHHLSREWQNRRDLTKSMLMYPIFITDDPDACQVIESLPGQKRWGVNRLEEFIGPLIKKGLKSVILFGVPFTLEKDAKGTCADTPDTPVILATKKLKSLYPNLFIAADVCLCEYTSHGHCGILRNFPGSSATGDEPDLSLEPESSAKRIREVAVAYAEAGVDCVAPSDMMDGRIREIKLGLMAAGKANKVLLMSYSAKFASSLYGPFREAAGSAPGFGNRKCYQLPPNAAGLANRAIRRDVEEGADIIMVKPSLPYVDIIASAARIAPDHGIACYQVSGEYAMIVAGADKGIYGLREMAFESIESFVRAGAGIILTYFTPQMLDWLDEPLDPKLR